MKKYIGAICSGLAGIVTFVFMSVAYIKQVMTMGALTQTEYTHAWDLFDGASNEASYTLWKIFAIAAIVMAAILIINALLVVLQNKNVLKAKFSFNKLNTLMLIVFAICAMVAFVALFVFAGKISGTFAGIELVCTPGIGAWIVTIFGVLATMCALLFTEKAKK